MSLLGTLFKGVAGFVTGGPLGAAHAVLGPKIAQAKADSVISRSFTTPFTSSQETRIYTSPGGYDHSPVAAAQAMQTSGACPAGFRFNKSRYVTRGGGTSKWPVGLQLHEKGTVCVKRRKINAGNGRAATHAVHRLVAFYRLSNRVAKQLRKAAARAHLRGARRGGRPRGLLTGGKHETVVIE